MLIRTLSEACAIALLFIGFANEDKLIRFELKLKQRVVKWLCE